MKTLITNFLTNIFGILIARHIVPGFLFEGDVLLLLEGAAILTIMNYVLKPVLKFIFFPFIMLTLGLFTIAINMLVLWVITQFPLGVYIRGVDTLLYATLLFSIINFILHLPLSQRD